MHPPAFESIFNSKLGTSNIVTAAAALLCNSSSHRGYITSIFINKYGRPHETPKLPPMEWLNTSVSYTCNDINIHYCQMCGATNQHDMENGISEPQERIFTLFTIPFVGKTKRNYFFSTFRNGRKKKTILETQSCCRMLKLFQSIYRQAWHVEDKNNNNNNRSTQLILSGNRVLFESSHHSIVQ